MIIKKTTTNIVDKIKTSEAFVAIISKNFVIDETKLKECQMAEKMNKPMYAFIKDQEAWEQIKDRFMWRKSFPVSEQGINEMRQDLQIIRAVKDA